MLFVGWVVLSVRLSRGEQPACAICLSITTTVYFLARACGRSHGGAQHSLCGPDPHHSPSPAALLRPHRGRSGDRTEVSRLSEVC